MRRFAAALTLALAVSMRTADACPPVQPFIDKLKAGTDPGAFPDDASGCKPDFHAELGAAFTAFLEKNPPSKVQPVVATIREWHRGKKWETAYGNFATAVQTKLGARFTIPQAADKYTWLDGVHPLAGIAEPVPEVKPKPQPKPQPKQQRAPPPAPPIKRSIPIATLLLWIAAVSAYVAGGLATAVLVRVLVTHHELARRIDGIANGVADVKNQLRLAFEKLEKGQTAIAENLAASLDRPLLAPEHLAPLVVRLDDLRQQVARIEIREPMVMPSPSGGVVLEREALAESWKAFCGNRELFAAYENARQSDAWQQVDTLFDGLAGYVPEDLKPTFEAVLAPARDYGNLVRRLQLVPRLIGAEGPKLPEAPSEAKELLRIRDLAQALATAQNGGAERLRFRFRSWVTDSFLGFADLFLQRYQQARLDKRHAELEAGVDIVRRVLKAAAVEPIDVRLGETPFDSTRHVGRSMSSDPRFPDGVITAVVRNGFVESGQQVIRQPEVVVNRVR